MLKNFRLFTLVMIVASFGCVAEPTKINAKPNTIPALQEWTGAEGYFTLDKNVHIIASSNESVKIAQAFAEDVRSLTGNALPIESKDFTGPSFSFVITKAPELGDEGYTIRVADKIIISANKPAGLFYGSQSLLQILAQDPGQQLIPKGDIKDFPIVRVRAVMLDVGRKYFEMDYLKKTIRNLAWYKYNTFHIHFTDWNGFRLKSDKFPTLASPQAYSKADIREIQDYAHKYNIMILPEIDLPAHSTYIVRYNPDFGFKCPSMNYGKWVTPEMLNKVWPDPNLNIYNAGWILDVSKPQTRQFIKDLFDEFIPLFDAPYFHIGGDEWQFDDQKEACPELMAYTKAKGFKYPGDVFVDWINEANKQVKSYGKTTQIWNWWSYSAGGKFNNTSIKPDTDIIINVWNKVQESEILKGGYKIISTTEEGPGALYVTPGSLGRSPGDYGYFDAKYNYETWSPTIDKKIEGFKLSIWADAAEDRSDSWYDRHASRPKAVLAERTWGKRDSETIEQFTLRMSAVGFAP